MCNYKREEECGRDIIILINHIYMYIYLKMIFLQHIFFVR